MVTGEQFTYMVLKEKMNTNGNARESLNLMNVITENQKTEDGQIRMTGIDDLIEGLEKECAKGDVI
jgi:hypothetical protein